MGQEWAATTPFQFFHRPPAYIGSSREGAGRSSPLSGFRRPAPGRGFRSQAESTFEASRLVWTSGATVARVRARALPRFRLRLTHPGLGASLDCGGQAFAPDKDSLVIRRVAGGSVYWIAARLLTAGVVDLAPHARVPGASQWSTLLTTEDPAFAVDPRAPVVDGTPAGPRILFARAGAVILTEHVPE